MSGLCSLGSTNICNYMMVISRLLGGGLRLFVRVRTNGEMQREEAKERGGRVEGGGNKGGSPGGAVGGLSHARTCGGCSGSLDWRKCAGGAEKQQQAAGAAAAAAVQEPSKGFHFISDSHRKGRGEHRVQLGQSELTGAPLRANSSRGK